MKTIGLLGGTGWASTIGYYRLLNELVAERLGGYHSAKILLKSIDYHDIMSSYGKDHKKVAQLLKHELKELIALHPDCLMICCNTLHKYYETIKEEIRLSMPLFHAVELVAQHLINNKKTSALLLATKFTMEDGFFANILKDKKIEVTIPDQEERNEMEKIHFELMKADATESSRNYFAALTQKYRNVDAVILGCTEYTLVLDKDNSSLPIVDPMFLQAKQAVEYALAE
ncbi:MAG: aspartate racemase [Gammaproteobacteria bacterium]|jgi:aspartate racemase|nr:aspartate racemase [Gammaproteobacteria bacterium]